MCHSGITFVILLILKFVILSAAKNPRISLEPPTLPSAGKNKNNPTIAAFSSCQPPKRQNRNPINNIHLSYEFPSIRYSRYRTKNQKTARASKPATSNRRG
jgi:hypothetical protein